MKSIGGNRGYIGYSESVRSYNAKLEGRFPKTLFKKEYNITEKKFKELENRGVIYVSEWHHTSKFGNKTNFYSFDNEVLFLILCGRKEEAFKKYKETRKYFKPIKRSDKSYINKVKFLSQATEHFLGVVQMNEIVKYKGQYLQCCHFTKHRKAPQFKIIKP